MTAPGILVRWYRRLLRLLPRRMYRVYGDEMSALYAEEWRRAGRNGRVRRLLSFARATSDLLRRLPGEYWRMAAPDREEEAMTNLLADARFAARSFVRQPAATILLLLTLTLAVAANVGVFVLLDGLFLRPVPFSDPGRLMYLNESAPRLKLEFTGINYPDFVAWRGHTHSFSAMGLFDVEDFTVTEAESVDRVRGANVTWDLPAALGIAPVLGRSFTAADDRPGAPPVVMLGYRYWRTRFNGARNIVGKVLRIDRMAFTIVGVLPVSAEFPGAVNLWTPLAADSNQPYQNYQMDGIARLKPGVSIREANADLRAAQQPIWRARDSTRMTSPLIMPLGDRVAKDFTTVGGVLGLGVVLVLLSACANVGGALLARGTFRKRELAIRVALGASGRRIVRQLLTEALVLASIAGVLGTALGWWGVRILVLSFGDRVPGWVHVDFSVRIALFGGLIIGVIALLYGAIPAVQARRESTREAIGSGSQRGSASRSERRMLDALVIFEVALAAILLVAGGLLWRTYGNLRHVDPGFRTDGVAEFAVALPSAIATDGAVERRLLERITDSLAAIPGATSAGAVNCAPLGCHWGRLYVAEGSALKPGGENPIVLTRIASPDYFRTMGVRFVQGRAYLPSEERPMGGLFPVVVNEEFAKLQWPATSNVIGRRVSYAGPATNTWMTVVGVVKDVKHYGLSEPMRPGLYLPMSILDSSLSRQQFSFAVHTAGEPAALLPAIRSVVRATDPELPVIQLRTMRDALDASLVGQRTLMIVLASFATIALMLSISGVYAVLSYVVGRRRREIGIRMALGAQRGEVVRMVVGRGALLIVIGLAIGIPTAFVASHLLTALLVGVTGSDPVTYLLVIVVLMVSGALAAFTPARRAASVDPTAALAEAS